MLPEIDPHVVDMLPAYVLEDISQDERIVVHEHLEKCPSCRLELALLQQVAGELPLAVTQFTPPAELKARLMQSIHTRQPVPAEGLRHDPVHQVVSRFLRRPLPAIGLALIILLALGNILLWRQLNRADQQIAPSVRVISLSTTPSSQGATGVLILDPQGKHGTVVVDHLAVLNAARQYQVWLIKDNNRTSGGLFSVNPDGYASLEIQSTLPLNSYDSIGITVEPYGGSPGPTGAKVLGGNIVQ